MLERLKVTPEQRDMFTVLAHALEQAQEEHESKTDNGLRALLWERQGCALAEDDTCLAKKSSSATPLPLRRVEAERVSHDGCCACDVRSKDNNGLSVILALLVFALSHCRTRGSRALVVQMK